MYEASLKNQDHLEKILEGLYHDFSQSDTNTGTRLVSNVLNNLPNVLDALLQIYPHRTQYLELTFQNAK